MTTFTPTPSPGGNYENTHIFTVTGIGAAPCNGGGTCPGGFRYTLDTMNFLGGDAVPQYLSDEDLVDIINATNVAIEAAFPSITDWVWQVNHSFTYNDYVVL